MIELVGVWMGHQASDGAPCNNYVLFTKHPHAYLLLPEKKQMKRTVSISEKNKKEEGKENKNINIKEWKYLRKYKLELP